MRLVAVILFVFLSVGLLGQVPLRSAKQLPNISKSIVEFIEWQQKNGIEYFDQLVPSITEATSLAEYDSNCHRFYLKISPEKAWEYYTQSYPFDVWKGKVVNLGLVFDKANQKIISNGDAYKKAEIGQIYFIEMSVFFQKVKFPVCMVITQVDEALKKISFSYVKSGESMGEQTIQLFDDGKGGTKILHSSHHLTTNPLRDKTLYPIYHKKAISEVHKNVKNKIGQ